MAEKRSFGKSRTGVEVAEDVIERMAAEAEAGLDVTKLRRHPFRFDPEVREASGIEQKKVWLPGKLSAERLRLPLDDPQVPARRPLRT